MTNFDMSRYDVNSILESSTLPIGGTAKRMKEVSEHAEASVDARRTDHEDITVSHLTDGICSNYGSHQHFGWPAAVAYQQNQQLGLHYPYVQQQPQQQQRGWCKQEQDPVTAAVHGYQDLHLGNNTHNFFHPPGLHNLMGMDSTSSMDHSSDSNFVLYNGGGSSNHGYMMPMSLVGDHGQQGSTNNNYGDQHDHNNNNTNSMLVSSTDLYSNGRNNNSNNVYYLSQQSPGDCVKTNGYDHHNWAPTTTPVPGITPNGANTIAGAPVFSVWNDA